MKKRKTRRPMPKLYKEFYSQPEYYGGRVVLAGPYSGKGYRNERDTRLSPGTLKPGWRSKRIAGKLAICGVGFHAGTLKGWFNVRSENAWKRTSNRNAYLAEVKLIEVDRKQPPRGGYRGGKYVGRQFEIVRVVGQGFA